MNQLSWLLYMGNVAGHLGGFFVFFGIVCAVFIVVMIITSFVELDSMSRYCVDNEKAVKDSRKARRWACAFIPVIFILWVMAALCPSQETVYAIAASEMGGKVLSSTTGSLAEQALNAWLKRQIAPPPTPVAPTNQ